jgi:hypothetical protein
VFGDAPDQKQFVLDGSFFIGISKPHQTPNGGVAARFKMLTYY